MNKVMLIIIGMTVATYLPRLFPFVIVSQGKLPPKVKQFLMFIPYTALGALIIPGVFNAIPESPLAAGIGISFALIFAWFKGGIIIPVLGSILLVWIYLSFGVGF